MARGAGLHLTLLELADYRRRTADIYAAVRRLGAGPEAWRLWIEARDELFRAHPQSALEPADRASFTGLPYHPYDPTWHVTAELEPAGSDARRLGHSGDGETSFATVGTVHFTVDGTDHALELLWFDSYGGGLFLPFRDATSGDTTYGGGRYLLDGAKAADLGTHDGALVLDFNFAYHPSCVHSPRWSCPLAPPGNRLAATVTAGERLADRVAPPTATLD